MLPLNQFLNPITPRFILFRQLVSIVTTSRLIFGQRGCCLFQFVFNSSGRACVRLLILSLEDYNVRLNIILGIRSMQQMIRSDTFKASTEKSDSIFCNFQHTYKWIKVKCWCLPEHLDIHYYGKYDTTLFFVHLIFAQLRFWLYKDKNDLSIFRHLIKTFLHPADKLRHTCSPLLLWLAHRCLAASEPPSHRLEI